METILSKDMDPKFKLDVAAYPGGDFPWFKVTNTHDWAASATSRFFRVVTE